MCFKCYTRMGKVSDVNSLRGVEIGNSYLQESLNEFIEEHS